MKKDFIKLGLFTIFIFAIILFLKPLNSNARYNDYGTWPDSSDKRVDDWITVGHLYTTYNAYRISTYTGDGESVNTTGLYCIARGADIGEWSTNWYKVTTKVTIVGDKATSSRSTKTVTSPYNLKFAYILAYNGLKYNNDTYDYGYGIDKNNLYWRQKAVYKIINSWMSTVGTDIIEESYQYANNSTIDTTRRCRLSYKKGDRIFRKLIK